MKKINKLVCFAAALTLTAAASCPLFKSVLRSEAKETDPETSILCVVPSEPERTRETEALTEKEETTTAPAPGSASVVQPENTERSAATSTPGEILERMRRDETSASATATQPAPTNPAPPSTTYVPVIPSPPAKDVPKEKELPFTVRSVRVGGCWERDFVPKGSVIDDHAALEARLTPYAAQTYNQELPEELQNVLTKCSETWFRTHRLLLLEIQATSGSHKYVIDRVERTKDGAHVEYHRQRPQVCTCDVANWYIFVGVEDTTLCAEDVVTLEKTKDTMNQAKPWVGSGPPAEAETEYIENDDWLFGG